MKQQKKRRNMNGITVPRIIDKSEGLEEQSVLSLSHICFKPSGLNQIQ